MLQTARVVCPLVLAAAAMPSAAAEQARLTIDDNVYNVPLGKAFAVRIDGKRVTLRIDPQSDRSFDADGVSFRYPTALEPSESDAGEGITVWTLQGRNAAIMLQKYDGGIDPKSLLEVMIGNIAEREGADASKRQAVKLTGAERAYQGVQLRTAAAAEAGAPATESVQNLFTFANSGGVFALMIQDVHAPGAGDSGEYADALRLLGESLKTGVEPPPAEPNADAG